MSLRTEAASAPFWGQRVKSLVDLLDSHSAQPASVDSQTSMATGVLSLLGAAAEAFAAAKDKAEVAQAVVARLYGHSGMLGPRERCASAIKRVDVAGDQFVGPGHPLVP